MGLKEPYKLWRFRGGPVDGWRVRVPESLATPMEISLRYKIYGPVQELIYRPGTVGFGIDLRGRVVSIVNMDRQAASLLAAENHQLHERIKAQRQDIIRCIEKLQRQAVRLNRFIGAQKAAKTRKKKAKAKK